MYSHYRIPSVPAVAAALCALLASINILGSTLAAEPYVLWATTAPGPDSFGRMAVSPAGDLYKLRGFNPQRLLKFDPQGRLVSSNAVDSLPGQLSFAGGVWVDTTGASYFAGLGGPDGGKAFSVVKLSAAGELAWVSRESTPLSGSPYAEVALATDQQGNLCVGGVSTGPITLGSYAFGEGGGPLLCKYDRDGNVLWARRIEHQITSSKTGVSLNDLAVDSSGNIVISGFLAGGSADFGGTIVYPGATVFNNWGDGFIAKYDPNGNLLWVVLNSVELNTLGLDSFQVGMSLATDRQNNIYFLGGGKIFGKLNPAGGLIWSKYFPSAYPWHAQAIAVDAQDQPVFIGEISETTSLDAIVLHYRGGNADFFVAKADGDGNIQWAISGGGSDSDAAISDAARNVVCDRQGNIFFCGWSETSGSFDGIPLGGNAMVLFKISPTPPLRIASSPGAATIFWPAKATNYVLEATTSLSATTWNLVTNNPTVGPTERSVQLPLTGAAKFFRLRQP